MRRAGKAARSRQTCGDPDRYGHPRTQPAHGLRAVRTSSGSRGQTRHERPGLRRADDDPGRLRPAVPDGGGGDREVLRARGRRRGRRRGGHGGDRAGRGRERRGPA
ncbi:hypothetical protein ADL35_45905, partial [Streptomyces sp. NRRL WC-3753]